jgi:hypothetical protein
LLRKNGKRSFSPCSQHRKNKKQRKDQAEIILDDLRFLLDGIHRLYISSQKKDWIEETNWNIVFSKITVAMIFFGGIFKAVTHAQKHFTSCFRKLSSSASFASIG